VHFQGASEIKVEFISKTRDAKIQQKADHPEIRPSITPRFRCK
jgi:hypothetical protein